MDRYNREILLIAPDSPERQLWVDGLATNGWNIHFATELSQLNAYKNSLDPAVILADCELLNRKEVTQLLAVCQEFGEGTATVPVLAEDSTDHVIHCIRHGANDVLIKPFQIEELISVLSRASGLKQALRDRQMYRDQLELANHELKESLKVLRQDQLAGRQVQRSMLPKTPQHHKQYTIAHHIIPSLYLSGDFVGYHVLLDRYLIFYFADVSGHGASSAFVTVLLRFMLNRIIRRHVLHHEEENLAKAPLGLAESLNRQLLATGLDKHMTLFAGSIDTRKHVLRYVVGAQMPMPIIVTDGKAEFLPGKGKPVGLFEDASWDVQEMSLPEQFSLFVVSDGVFEHMEGDSLSDKEQQLLHLAETKGSTLEGICEGLGLEGVVDEALDDISLLFVSRN
ncbi:SpoIIE family protein phosphatase [Porticoccaceae bacterium LTM1]|nr:SpoIIE family protein phosphatase [Porticoccaceae bacterium LTM1]